MTERDIKNLKAERDIYKTALERLRVNRLSDSNCESVELAGRRVATIATLALRDGQQQQEKK
jgi:hypothetical protein